MTFRNDPQIVLHNVELFIQAHYVSTPDKAFVSKQDMLKAFLLYWQAERHKEFLEDVDANGPGQADAPELPPKPSLFFECLPLAMAMHHPEAMLTRPKVDNIFGPWSYRGLKAAPASAVPEPSTTPAPAPKAWENDEL